MQVDLNAVCVCVNVLTSGDEKPFSMPYVYKKAFYVNIMPLTDIITHIVTWAASPEYII